MFSLLFCVFFLLITTSFNGATILPSSFFLNVQDSIMFCFGTMKDAMPLFPSGHFIQLKRFYFFLLPCNKSYSVFHRNCFCCFYMFFLGLEIHIFVPHVFRPKLGDNLLTRNLRNNRIFIKIITFFRTSLL